MTTIPLPLLDGVPAPSAATFSPHRTYRYALTRRWGEGPTMVVIGLNPSTANETANDPTIRRCIGFATRDGCGGLVMLNLFALRATNPRVMLAHPEPIGPENDATILRHTAGAERVVVAWGAHGGHLERDRHIRALVPGATCFGVTAAGHPRHPLYLRADTPLVAWRST